MDYTIFVYTIMIFIMVCFLPILIMSWMARKVTKSVKKLAREIKRV